MQVLGVFIFTTNNFFNKQCTYAAVSSQSWEARLSRYVIRIYNRSVIITIMLMLKVVTTFKFLFDLMVSIACLKNEDYTFWRNPSSVRNVLRENTRSGFSAHILHVLCRIESWHTCNIILAVSRHFDSCTGTICSIFVDVYTQQLQHSMKALIKRKPKYLMSIQKHAHSHSAIHNSHHFTYLLSAVIECCSLTN
jgi:hypothetical protein